MSYLRLYVDAWKHSADAIASLEVPSDAWERETDLPGWRVRDILAHLVHLERVLVEGEEEVRGKENAPVPSDYTNAGVDALRNESVETLRADFARLISARFGDLAELPEDGTTAPARTPANAPWDTETLLRNRAFDMWMHEQDIRRASDLPGNLDSPGAHIAVTILSMALPFVVGKKAKAPVGTHVRFVVTGPVAVDSAVVVGEDGRARAVEGADGKPDATITMDTETFVVLGGGRRTPDQVNVEITGNSELGQQVVSALNVTF